MIPSQNNENHEILGSPFKKNNENHENSIIQRQNHEIIKKKIFHARITKVIKFYWIPRQNNENHENLNISRHDHENHEIHRILCQNNSNHENSVIPKLNYENHEIHRIP